MSLRPYPRQSLVGFVIFIPFLHRQSGRQAFGFLAGGESSSVQHKLPGICCFPGLFGAEQVSNLRGKRCTSSSRVNGHQRCQTCRGGTGVRRKNQTLQTRAEETDSERRDGHKHGAAAVPSCPCAPGHCHPWPDPLRPRAVHASRLPARRNAALKCLWQLQQLQTEQINAPGLKPQQL